MLGVKCYSNCTNVGLKWLSGLCRHHAELSILIAPMWDWNALPFPFRRRLACHSNCTNVGLKYGYGWRGKIKTFNSNCTNVGLKWRCDFVYQRLPTILIAPMWDWNEYAQEFAAELVEYSNCTNVGLKSSHVSLMQNEKTNSNCTNVGLKCCLIMEMWVLTANSNCTNVGLKFCSRVASLSSLCILIAPMWDWNQGLYSSFKEHHSF